MSSGIQVDPEAMAKIDEMKKDKTILALALMINEERTKIVVDNEFTDFVNQALSIQHAEEDDDYICGKVQRLMKGDEKIKSGDVEFDWHDECRYVLMSIKNKRQNKKLAEFLWNSDQAGIKKKMCYASTLNQLKTRLEGYQYFEVHDPEEFLEKFMEVRLSS